ncbi:aldose 1-epimerase family protein [Hansschlegelia plantiphila]|uniref:Aldose 1-epimerase n=1 Tax=Hansschlegelia plantiphila TaxID=374655 RepID=A0A9W6MU32_9HYPH|nr:aldose 1-epimerase family protein [Hansschlegelia plantiphila]GLK66984.1 aldose 1-epimerase [Hansschlegelia plantiphila]
MTDTCRIRAASVSAEVSAKGAELVSLKDAAGEELLWQAGPEWPRHAPVLFPIVGRLSGDLLRHDGAAYRMTQHGFARDSLFEWTERSESRVALSLADSAATRAAYPFAFRLELVYAVEGGILSMISRVTNPGAEALPFCIGAHPAFRWPLAEGVAKDGHALEFATQERGVARSVEDGLLGPEEPLPFDGVTLALSPDLFAKDALVLPDVASRSVRYVAKAPEGGVVRALTVSWRGYGDLGVWSKPSGASFLCIEPWRGMASPIGWDGAFEDKPGVVRLQPGATMEFEIRFSIGPAGRP